MTGGHRCFFPPRCQPHQLFHLLAAIGGQQLRQGIGSRKYLRPAVQHLPGLLPGFAPAPAVLHLIEEVLDGPASGIVLENLLGPQFTAGGEEKALLAELARIILELHPHGPDLVTVEEFGQADSSTVLPLTLNGFVLSDYLDSVF